MMDELMTRCVTHIQAIIDQLYADLDAIPEGTDTAAIKQAIQTLESILHQYEK